MEILSKNQDDEIPGPDLTVSPKPIFELLERPVASSCLLVNPHISLRGHTEVHRELVGR
jgi:hypothetical protein